MAYRIVFKETEDGEEKVYPPEWSAGHLYRTFREAAYDFVYVVQQYHSAWVEGENGVRLQPKVNPRAIAPNKEGD
jgi:hypothetical protein